MTRHAIAVAALCITSGLSASDYTFLNSYNFVEGKKIFHFEADYGQVGSAKITTDPVYGTKTNFAEGNSSIYLTYYLNEENALTWQFGANYINLGWDENPLFTKNEYTYGVGSLSWISTSILKWRFIINAGVAVDATTFNFTSSGVYYTMLWGRYQQLENLGLHLGFFAYYGAQNGYVLPILGFDWQISPKWSLNAIFPIDASLNFHFTKHFVSSIIATYLGGPYRFPRKVHGGIGNYSDGVFKVFSTVVEGDLAFVVENLIEVGVGGGWNFGGWIQTSEYNNHNKQYYYFNGAAYGRLYATLSF